LVHERGQNGYIEDARLRVKEIGDQPTQEKSGIVRGYVGLDRRSVLAPPALPREPKQIKHPSPAQRFVKRARTGNKCREAKRRGQTHYQKPERDPRRRGKARSASRACAEHGEICHVRPRRQLDHEASEHEGQQYFSPRFYNPNYSSWRPPCSSLPKAQI